LCKCDEKKKIIRRAQEGICAVVAWKQVMGDSDNAPRRKRKSGEPKKVFAR